MAGSEGVLDTCVVIELGSPTMDVAQLPDLHLVTSVTMGELAVGPLVARDDAEREQRGWRLRNVELTFVDATLDYDARAAHRFGRIVAGAIRAGRTSRARTRRAASVDRLTGGAYPAEPRSMRNKEASS